MRRAEDERFLALVDLIHEDFDAVGFAFLDLDNFVEVGFGVAPADFDIAFDEFVVRRVDVLIESGGDLLDLEGRKEAVVDAFFRVSR